MPILTRGVSCAIQTVSQRGLRVPPLSFFSPAPKTLAVAHNSKHGKTSFFSS